jgi:hypothetical protein
LVREADIVASPEPKSSLPNQDMGGLDMGLIVRGGLEGCRPEGVGRERERERERDGVVFMPSEETGLVSATGDVWDELLR